MALLIFLAHALGCCHQILPLALRLPSICPNLPPPASPTPPSLPPHPCSPFSSSTHARSGLLMPLLLECRPVMADASRAAEKRLHTQAFRKPRLASLHPRFLRLKRSLLRPRHGFAMRFFFLSILLSRLFYEIGSTQQRQCLLLCGDWQHGIGRGSRVFPLVCPLLSLGALFFSGEARLAVAESLIHTAQFPRRLSSA